MATARMSARRHDDAVKHKVFHSYEKLQREFSRLDVAGDGKIPQGDFRYILEQFGVEMSDDEFEKLLRAYDPFNSGKVSYSDFNKKLADLVHPSTTGALVVKPKQDGILRRKPKGITTARFASMVEGKVARRAVSFAVDIARHLYGYDKTNSGCISQADFITGVQEAGLNMPLSDLHKLMNACGINEEGKVVLARFAVHLRVLLGSKEYTQAPKARRGSVQLTPMSADDTLAVLFEKLFNRFKSVKQAFRGLDVTGTGKVPYSTFRRVLKDMGAVLDDDQFARVMKEFDPKCQGYVTYIHFNNVVGPVIQPGEEGAGLLVDRPSTPVLSPWVAPKWAQVAMQNHKTPADLFAAMDTDHSGGISVPEFVEAVRHAGFDLSHDEARTLVEYFKRDKQGNIPEKSFVDTVEAMLLMPTDPHAVPPPTFYAGVTQSAEDVDLLFAHKMFTKFRTVKRAFQLFDTDSSGDVSRLEFRTALATLGFNLTDYEFDTFISKYDPKNTDEITYRQFQQAVGDVIQPHVGDERARTKKAKKLAMTKKQLDVWWNQRLDSSTQADKRQEVLDSCNLVQGRVTFDELRSIARRLGISLSRNEAQRLIKMYADDPMADDVSVPVAKDLLNPAIAAVGEDVGEDVAAAAAKAAADPNQVGKGSPSAGADASASTGGSVARSSGRYSGRGSGNGSGRGAGGTPSRMSHASSVPQLPQLSLSGGSNSNSGRRGRGSGFGAGSGRGRGSSRGGLHRGASAPSLASVRSNLSAITQRNQRLQQQNKKRLGASGSLATLRVEPDKLAEVCAKIAAQLKGTSMKKVFAKMLEHDPQRAHAVPLVAFEAVLGSLGVQLDADARDTLEGQFGIMVQQPRDAGHSSSRSARILTMQRHIDYQACLRRIYLEKLQPGKTRLVFSPMRSQKPPAQQAFFGHGQPATAASSRSPVPESGRYSHQAARQSFRDEDDEDEHVARRLVTTPPRWPHTIDLHNEEEPNADGVIVEKMRTLKHAADRSHHHRAQGSSSRSSATGAGYGAGASVASEEW